MIESLREIPGPVFLLLYACLAALSIVMGRFITGLDGSRYAQMPDFTRFDPITISLLRGGWTHVIKTAVFDLLNKGLVTIEGKKQATTIVQTKLTEAERGVRLKTVKPVTYAIYTYITPEKESSDLFGSTKLRQTVDDYLVFHNRELEQFRLVKSEGDKKRIWTLFWILALVLFFIGFSKLVLGLMYGRPVIFLLIFMIATFILLPVIVRPWDQASWLGKKYLSELDDRFEWLKKKAKSKAGVPEGIDPAYIVAIFGVSALAGIDMYEDYRSAFHKQTGSGCGGCSYVTTGGCSDGGGGGGGCSGCGGCGGCGG